MVPDSSRISRDSCYKKNLSNSDLHIDPMNKERFSLRLLEPNEIYFEDFCVDLLPSPKGPTGVKVCKPTMGRLKLCSKSLVFDPKDNKLPLIKIPYKDSSEINTWPANPSGGSENNQLFIKCSQYVKMLENNILAPYEFVSEAKTFYFIFHYADLEDVFLQLCQQLHRASSLHALEQNNMIATIVFSRHTRMMFNPLWLESIYEKTLIDCKVNEVKPLVLNPGKLVLTNSYVYFQPYNNIHPYPVMKIKLCDISNMIKRRFLLRQAGLELIWKGSNHLYVAFCNAEERDNFCDLMMKQVSFKCSNEVPESMTLKWQNGLISNYDYLLYLNSLADRTTDDLTQYPVFPWVLTDYTSNKIDLQDERIYRDLSKPMGALNPERLQRLKERCEEMGDPKFLYGSHYSAPGFVLFYLVRKYPHLMLCLQNGKFDHPDRMFNKLSDTYNNCLNNMSDFKELIPEFYDTAQGGDFLENIHKINFGLRSDGSQVNHVKLPPWANNSCETFVQTLRNALESDYVSKNLNQWIDLIFGYKQRGEEALKANNLFYHLCYEGSVDLDTIKDANARHALEIQISEFGQIPKQLFTKPHVVRNLSSVDLVECSKRRSIDSAFMFELDLKCSYSAHKEPISSVSIDGDCIISTGRDGVLKLFNIEENKQIRNLHIANVPLSACYKIANSSVLVIGSWDDNILLYNCDYGRISDVIPAHDDAVSALSLILDLGILVSGSWDGTVKVWKGFTDIDYKSFRLSESMIGYFSFEDKVVCVDSKKKDDKVCIAAGTAAGEILTWDIEVLQLITSKLCSLSSTEPKVLVKHKAEISSFAFNENASKLASCSVDKQLCVTDVMTGMNLFNKMLEISVASLSWCCDSEFLLTVDSDGYLSIWDLLQGCLKCNTNVSKGPLTCVCYDDSKQLIITAGREMSEYRIKCWFLR